MRSHPEGLVLAAALLAAGTACAGQETWAEFRQAWRAEAAGAFMLRAGYGQRGRNPWCLLVREGDLEPGWWARDEILVRLVAERELTPELAGKARSAALAKLRGWPPGPHWLLLDAEGEVLLEGAGRPEGGPILNALRAAGFSSAWDRRETFLASHPDHGGALEARLVACANVLQARPAKAGIPGAEAADLEMEEVAGTLEALAVLPDWWRLGTWFVLGDLLERPAASASPRLRRVLGRLRESALAVIRQEPSAGNPEVTGLHRFWARSGWTLMGRRIPEVPPAVPTPGRQWPHLAYLQDVGMAFLDAGDWEGLLAFTDLLAAGPPEGPLAAAQWRSYLEWRWVVRFGRVLALTGLRRWNEGAAALGELMAWSIPGEDVKELPTLLAGVERDSRPEGGSGPGQEGPAALPPGYRELLERGPGPAPARPPSPFPLRLVRWGDPPWRAAWEALPAAPALAGWGPEDLRWEKVGRRDRALLEGLGWREPRWAALQGEGTLLAGGEGLPDARLLAEILGASGPTDLQRLDAFIRRHPDQLDARRERFAQVRPRMPHGTLEATLAEDAGRAWIPLDFGPEAAWIAQPRLWERHAAELLPQVEAALHRWPSSAPLWALWLSWAPFRGGSPYALAQDLDHLEPQPLWLAGLPRALHVAVAAELRRRRRFDLMGAWFAAALEGAGDGGNAALFRALLAEARRGA